MTEHVHEWEWIYDEARFECKACDGHIYPSDGYVSICLNATERLSAADARYYGELSGITLIRDAMMAYADTRESE